MTHPETAPSLEAGSAPRGRTLLGLTVAMLAFHLGLWAWTMFRRGLTPGEALDRWDSALYTHIILEGYDPALRAFLPVYPRAVGLLHTLTGSRVPPWVLGSALSTALRGVSCV